MHRSRVLLQCALLTFLTTLVGAQAPGSDERRGPDRIDVESTRMIREHTTDPSFLTRWVDHPQRVWDVVDRSLSLGVETVIHVGPEPNILPATYTRLSNNIAAQLSGTSITSLGLRAVSRVVRNRPWLTKLMSSDATLLRAPFVEQIILEDWLLEQM